jgi:hypothetical protein
VPAESVLNKSQRLQAGDFERLAAADVGAAELVVATDHVGLGLGELGAVALIGMARKLRLLAPDDPGYLVLSTLAALGAGEGVGALLCRFVEEITLIHGPVLPANVRRQGFPRGAFYSILVFTIAECKDRG